MTKRTMAQTFSKRVRELRKAKGLTQAGLGDLIKTSGQFVSMLEAGKRRADLDLIEIICKALDCTLFDIFGNDALTKTEPDHSHAIKIAINILKRHDKKK